jgi:hypothetical protein
MMLQPNHAWTTSFKFQQQRPILRINQYISLETAPLIGGPSWVPLHCRVVLQIPIEYDIADGDDDNTMEILTQKTYDIPTNNSAELAAPSIPRATTKRQIVYDYIPQNASSTATLKRLLSLQSVPAQVRVKTKRQILDDDDDDESSAGTASISTIKHYGGCGGDDDEAIDDDNMTLLRLPVLYEHRANIFCRGYQKKDLHLLRNNCWTFAFNLIRTMLQFDDTANSIIQ